MAIVKPGSLFSLEGDYPFQMKKLPNYRWWKPLCAGLLGAVLFVVLQTIVYFAILYLSGSNIETLRANKAASSSYIVGDPSSPATLLMAFIPVACAIPSFAIAMRVFGLGNLGTLSSVEGKLRWKHIWSYAPLALAAGVVFYLIMFAINALQGGSYGDFTLVPVTLLIIVVLCPLQCAAEEYVCRGFVFQAFASWIPVVVIPLIIQTVIFVVLHGYNIVGLIGVGFVGLIAGWLTVKTGGLEAAITLHSVNNILSFMQSALFVSQATQSDITIVGLLGGAILSLILAAVIYQIAKRKGYIQPQPAEA
jgi:uncharacterized protein